MVDLKKVRQAIRSRLLEISSLPDVAWDNKVFDPQSKDSWIRENFFPTSERLVASNQVVSMGYAQFSLFVKIGSSSEALDDLAKSVVEKFKPATALVKDSVEIAIDRVERGNISSDGVWAMMPVRVYWRSYSQNT